MDEVGGGQQRLLQLHHTARDSKSKRFCLEVSFDSEYGEATSTFYASYPSCNKEDYHISLNVEPPHGF